MFSGVPSKIPKYVSVVTNLYMDSFHVSTVTNLHVDSPPVSVDVMICVWILC